MNRRFRPVRHIHAEVLSAYLDRELEVSRLREVELHLAACGPCRARLDDLRRVVGGLELVARAAPPPELAAEVRRRVAAAPPAPLAARLGAFVLSLTVRPVLAAAAGLVLAVGLTVLLQDLVLSRQHALSLAPPRGTELISSYPGDPLFVPKTTSQVAGRVFVLEDTTWVERGLEGDQPEWRIDVASPQGRELLSHHADLGYLTADGTGVVMRYNRATLELYDWGARAAAWRPAG